MVNKIPQHLKAMELEKPEWLEHLQKGIAKELKAYSPEEPFLIFIIENEDYLLEFAYSLSTNTKFCLCTIDNPLTQCRRENCDWYVPIVRLIHRNYSKIEEFKYSGTENSLN